MQHHDYWLHFTNVTPCVPNVGTPPDVPLTFLLKLVQDAALMYPAFPEPRVTFAGFPK
jgi:hypothetical protein